MVSVKNLTYFCLSSPASYSHLIAASEGCHHLSLLYPYHLSLWYQVTAIRAVRQSIVGYQYICAWDTKIGCICSYKIGVFSDMYVFTCMYVHTIQFSMTGSLHEQLETIRLFVISSEYIHTYPDELTSDRSQYKYTASVGRVEYLVRRAATCRNIQANLICWVAQ